MLNLKESYLLKKGILWTFSHKISPLNNYGILRTGDIEDSDIEDTTLRTGDIEDRRRWGQATLRTGDIEDRRHWGQNYFENINNIKICKVVKILKKLSKILDIWCQHLGDECFYWIYAANIWRKYVILRVSKFAKLLKF